MKDVVLLVVGALLGGVVGLVFAVYFQDKWRARIVRRKNITMAKVMASISPEQDGPAHVAGRPTTVFIADGDGELVLEPQNISIRLRSEPVRLPAIVSRRREQVLRELQAQRRGTSGVAPTWNGRSLLALRGYRISRAGAREDAKLDLETAPVDYATFATTVLGLDAEFDADEVERTTLRREYLSSRDIEKEAVARPIPFLANGIGIALVAFTDDDKLLLARRRPQAKARGGERDVSVVEGMHVDLDRLPTGKLDPYLTAVRGCQEELGIEVSQDDVRLLGFVVDMAYYQWNFVGLVNVPMTAAQVLHAQTLHAKDRWEARLEPVDIDPAAVFTRIRDDGMWDLGLVTTYFALSSRCGPAAVSRAANRVLR